MRLAIDLRSLIEPCPSGISVYTREITRHLLALGGGHDFVLFCTAYRGLRPEVIQTFKATKTQFVRRRIPSKLLNASLWLSGAPYLDRLAGGADVYFLPSLTFCSVSPRCKLIVTLHDLSFEYPNFYSRKGTLWHRAIRPRRILERANAVVAVSESTRRDCLQRYAIKPEKVHTIYSGVTWPGQPIKNETIQPSMAKPYVLYVGTIEERKNISTILDAWQLVRQRLSQRYELLLAGKKNDTLSLSIPPGVRYLGYISNDEKQQLYHGASAFLYPSFYEGFGFPILEAMAYGKPVVTSFSTALPEVAREAALLVDPYNVHDVAEGLYAALADQRLRHHLTSIGPRLAEQYSWQNTARGLFNIINTLK